MIFHGPNFWKWFIGPGIIYLVERIRRLIWLRSQSGKTYISSGLLLPSKVTHLVIKRPPHFHFHPGDYVFVNIPVIAKYEWHPFTISSAPEQEGEPLLFFAFSLPIALSHFLVIIYYCMIINDAEIIGYLWLHIRAVGEWTNSLYSYFEKQQIKLHHGDILPIENTANSPRKKS